LYEQIVPLHIIECGGDDMFKRGTLMVTSMFCIMIIFLGSKNINLIKYKIQGDKLAIGYSEYMEYMAWESKMINENPEYEAHNQMVQIFH